DRTGEIELTAIDGGRTGVTVTAAKVENTVPGFRQAAVGGIDAAVHQGLREPDIVAARIDDGAALGDIGSGDAADPSLLGTARLESRAVEIDRAGAAATGDA